MSGPRILPPTLEILRAYWKSDRWMLLVVGSVVMLSSIVSVGAPYLFSQLVDRLQQDGAATALAWGFVAYATTLGISSAFQQMVGYLSFMSSENLGFITSTRFFERILAKTADFFVAHNPAEIQNASERGRGALTRVVQLGIVAFIPGATQIVLTILTLGTLINLEVAAIVVIYGIIAMTLTFISVQRSRVFLDQAIGASQENARFVGNAMNAMETLRHFGSHDWMTRRFTEKAQEIRDNWRAYVHQRVFFVALLGIGLAVQFAVTFLLLLPRFEAGTLTIGGIVLFNTLLLQLNLPFQMIAHAIDDAARVRASLTPLATMWAAPEERRLSNGPAFLPKDGLISFENVSFCYENRRGLDEVSFTAERGGITFLVGETGSGKSTVFRLALKSVEPQSGRIVVDGTDLACMDRADWYAFTAIVPQDAILLNESLANNILVGRSRDEVRLREVVEKAALQPFIEALPEKLETTVGERGLKLSGGERQRIAIARALYGNPAVLFLDEASSALDEATERDIMDHIRMLARDVTVIAITHRRSVITITDNVVQLSKSGMKA